MEEKLAHTPRASGLDAACELAAAMVLDDKVGDRYPNRTSLIPADSPDFGRILARDVREGNPIAIVFPNGCDVLLVPKPGRLASLRRRLAARSLKRVRLPLGEEQVKGAGTMPVLVPPGYTREIRVHEPAKARATKAATA